MCMARMVKSNMVSIFWPLERAATELKLANVNATNDSCPRRFRRRRTNSSSFGKAVGGRKELGGSYYFVACDESDRRNQEEILRQRQRFEQIGVEYELWDAAELRNKLRPQPGVVATYLEPSDYWLRVICGQVPQVWTQQGQTPSLMAVAGQLERVAAALSSDALREAGELRGIWREGREKEVRQRIASLKSNRDCWTILSPDSRAHVLRLEASLVLSTTGNVGKSRTVGRSSPYSVS